MTALDVPTKYTHSGPSLTKAHVVQPKSWPLCPGSPLVPGGIELTVVCACHVCVQTPNGEFGSKGSNCAKNLKPMCGKCNGNKKNAYTSQDKFGNKIPIKFRKPIDILMSALH